MQIYIPNLSFRAQRRIPTQTEIKIPRFTRNDNMYGFTLVELGMVLAVIGLITGSIFNYMSHSTKKENDLVTSEKQQKIAIALSNFAQSHGYLPCPSRTTAGNGTTDSPTIGEAARRCDSTSAHAQRYGIVPFKTLGLSQNDVIDGYGNPFTYAVSRSANHIPVINPIHKSETELETYPACNDKPLGNADHAIVIMCEDNINYNLSPATCISDNSAHFKSRLEALILTVVGKNVNLDSDDYVCLLVDWPKNTGAGVFEPFPTLMCLSDQPLDYTNPWLDNPHWRGNDPFNVLAGNVNAQRTPPYANINLHSYLACSLVGTCYSWSDIIMRYPWEIDLSGSAPVGKYFFSNLEDLESSLGWVDSDLHQINFNAYTHLYPKAIKFGTPKKDFYSGIPGGSSSGAWSNQGAHKKYFCCRDDVGSLEVRIPENYVSPADGSWVRATDTQSGLTGLGDPPDGTNINQNLRYFAYVLLSHGADGDGAQIIGSTARKQTHIAGDFEQENSNASSLIFYDWPINTVRNNEHFNDLLLWRTQEQVMSESGVNSCRKP